MSQGRLDDPIAAIATAPGKGGVGVVRFSFPQFEQYHRFLVAFLKADIPVRQACFVRLKDQAGRLIDEGLALRFDAPASFTGEYVLEFQGHGGPGVLKAVLDRAFEVSREESIPLRHAQAGEFTQRAFLNDKLDLAQAEAVADLIDAGSSRAVKAAAASLQGEFSKRVHTLADKITHLRLLLEATLDFPEEEIDFLQKADARGQLRAILDDHTQLLKAAREGVKMREGLQLVLVGEPNVGKSSLLNALAGQEVAIVTPIAGTTRDRIKQDLTIRGVPLTVIDTAGLRETEDEVEKIGIQRTRQSIQEADVMLWIFDASDGLKGNTDFHQLHGLPLDLPVIRVLNKVDLLSQSRQSIDSEQAILAAYNRKDVDPGGSQDNYENHESRKMLNTSEFEFCSVSALTGAGLENLKDAILSHAGLSEISEHGFMARQRHVDALIACGKHLACAADFAEEDDRILDLFAEELRLAHDSLGEITGRLLPDDLLGLIFSRFCIGK